MKAGNKIYRELEALAYDHPKVMAAALKKLCRGDLRSLILHISRKTTECAVREHVLAASMCEVVRRFIVAKGKDIL